MNPQGSKCDFDCVNASEGQNEVTSLFGSSSVLIAAFKYKKNINMIKFLDYTNH